MKHEMPILTDEQREYLQSECIRLIAEAAVSGGYRTAMKGLVAEVALAALTAPPVPTLKPIELPDRNANEYWRGIKFLPLAYTSDVKQAIRAAGYEVKE